jgi:membrane protease YdiL (CAAX protease family)
MSHGLTASIARIRLGRTRPWALFAAHQVALFASGWAVLHAVRAWTGRSVHGGADPIGLSDGAVILSVYGAHLALTLWIDRRGGGPGSLGLRPSRHRSFVFAAGLATSVALFSAPWIFALASGRSRIAGTLAAHWHEVSHVSVAFGWIILFVNSFVEEATSRALPMRLFAARSLPFRVVVPSLVFAALHLADESFDAGRFASRSLAGITLSLAYAATGNVWLAAGIHTGMNYAAVAPSGLWHFGGLISLSAGDGVPGWSVNLAVAALATALFVWRGRKSARALAGGSAPASPR